MATKTYTFALIKPDAVASNAIGSIIAAAEADGFRVHMMRMVELLRSDIEVLYGAHEEKPFYPDLFAFMRSGPSVAMVLEREGDAVGAWRALMGATDSTKASPGTIRHEFGSTPVYRNAVHGSDSEHTASREIGYFFPYFFPTR